MTQKDQVQATRSEQRRLLLRTSWRGLSSGLGERERELERSVQQRCVTRLLCNYTWRYVALRGAQVACRASCSKVAPLAATHTSPAACRSQRAVGARQLHHPGAAALSLPTQSCRASCVCLSVDSLHPHKQIFC